MSYDYDALVKKIVDFRKSAAAAASLVTTESTPSAATAATNADANNDDNSDKNSPKIQLMQSLQGAMDAFEELSGHCPMTPLLWIHYGATVFDFCQELAQQQTAVGDATTTNNNDETDAAATNAAWSSSMETQLQILQLGLQEFPGSLLLQLRFLFLLQQLDERQQMMSQPQPPGQNVTSALERAIAEVGRGSHGSDGDRVVGRLYEPLAQRYAKQRQNDDNDKNNKFHRLLLREQASRPLPNDGLLAFYEKLCQEHNNNSKDQLLQPQPDAEQQMDVGRRLVAKLYDGALQLPQLEADISALLHSQQLVPPWHFLAVVDNDSNDTAFWSAVLAPSDTTTFGMGLAGTDVAQGFLTMATMLARCRDKVPNEDANNIDAVEKELRSEMVHDIHDLDVAVYERGVAECPTVEHIWIAYLNRLEAMVRERENLLERTPPDQREERLSSMRTLLQSCPQRLVAVSKRACRNCPYSLTLAQRQVHLQGVLAQCNLVVLDPEKLFHEMVQPALSSGFLVPADPAAASLYLTLLRVVQQRILALLIAHVPHHAISSMDTALDPAKQGKLQKDCFQPPIPPDTWTELQDLIQEFLELTTTMEESLAKLKTKGASLTRSLVYEQKALSMQHVLQPLLTLSPNGAASAASVNKNDDEALRWLQKAAKLQNPAHPDTQSAYIQYFWTSRTTPMTHPVEVAVRLCQVRFLYQKAVTLAGSNDNHANAATVLFQRDYPTALRSLTDKWLQFEHRFGSPQSVEHAQKAIQRKLERMVAKTQAVDVHSNQMAPVAKLEPPPVDAAGGDKMEVDSSVAKPADAAESQNEAKAESAEVAMKSPDPDEKGAKPANATESQNEAKPESAEVAKKSQDPNKKDQPADKNMETSAAEPAKASHSKPKKHEHMVKVGNLEYPAHPFTVRVFNLAESVHDMDLVDLLQHSKTSGCGKIVHARIMRDRHGHGKSKGWGLVQFEERESVEKALALHETIGLHEQSVSIQRSHTPAVPSIVPPGMHRVKPQGEGKASKRNLKRKAQKMEEHGEHDDCNPPRVAEPNQKQAAPATDNAKSNKPQASVLSFMPRKIAKGHGPKKKLG